MATTETSARTRTRPEFRSRLEALLTRAEGLAENRLSVSRLEALLKALDRHGSRWNHLTTKDPELMRRRNAASELVLDELEFARSLVRIESLLSNLNRSRRKSDQPTLMGAMIAVAGAMDELSETSADRVVSILELSHSREFLHELRILVAARVVVLAQVLDTEPSNYVFGELRGYVTRSMDGIQDLELGLGTPPNYNYWMVCWYRSKDEQPPLDEFIGELKDPCIPASSAKSRQERIAWHVQLQRYAAFVIHQSEAKKNHHETRKLATVLVAYATAYCANYDLGFEPLTLFGGIYYKLVALEIGQHNPFHVPHTA